jgi:regulator of nucleoside diphosphate kinase
MPVCPFIYSPDRGCAIRLNRMFNTHDSYIPSIPPDVVTVNSRVEVEDLQTGDRKVVTVVFPDAADARAGKVSVLAPLGVAVLGSRVGEVVECHRPGGPRRLRVNRLLFQPEAAGRYDL